ncbi:MAG: cytidylate kinase-like family protein, partial [Oscillospiraceae bacterium]|nr:cytidylate kinase-like family protein [Oscillospiraceae bacterium]
MNKTNKQLLISVSREFGSGGREIAHILAQRFGINYYDRNLLDEVAQENSFNAEKLRKFDEKPRRLFFSRTTSRGETNSPELIVANYQFDYLVKKANEGESFVIV